MPNRQDQYLDYEDGKMRAEAEQAGVVDHPTMTGTAREQILLKRLRTLPKRFTCAGGKVMGRDPELSPQIDVLICDHIEYVVIDLEDGSVMAAPESVFAALSVKSTVSSNLEAHENEARAFQEHVHAALAEPWVGVFGLVAYAVTGDRLDDLARNFTAALARDAGERLAFVYVPGKIVLADAALFALADPAQLPAAGASIVKGAYRAEGEGLFATVFRLLERHLTRVRRPESVTTVVSAESRETLLTESSRTKPSPVATPIVQRVALLDLGATTAISVGIRNDSTAPWSRELGTQAQLRFSTVSSSAGSDRLLAQPPQDAYAQQVDQVAPGEIVFFEIPLRASSEGAHDLVFDLSTGPTSTGVQLHSVVAIAPRAPAGGYAGRGAYDPNLHQGSRGMHPWLMDPTARYRLPIGGATGTVPVGFIRFSGKVTELVGGAPVAGVMVWAQDQLDRAIRTDGWGEWALDLVADTALSIHFEREGYERPAPRVATPAATRIDVQLARAEGLDPV